MQLKRITYKNLKEIISQEQLYQYLWCDNLNFKLIGQKYNVNQHQISKLAKDYNIPINRKAIGEQRNSSRIIDIDVTQLIDQYVNNKKSAREIAKEFKCSRGTVIKKLKKLNIEIRDACYIEYYNNRKNSDTPHYVDSFGYLKKGNNRQHREVMENYLGRRLSSKEHVHHIDFNRMNNEIDNLFLFEDGNIHYLYHGYIDYHSYISPLEYMIYYDKYFKGKIDNYEWLYNQYITLNKSCNQISKELKVSRLSLTKQLKRLEIYQLRKPTINQFC
jgi:DNA-binding Lrp family transcriptional regulator